MASGTIHVAETSAIVWNANYSFTSRSNKLVKDGKIVSLSAAGYRAAGQTIPNHADKFATIPEGFRPAEAVYAPVTLYNTSNGSTQILTAVFETNGEIYIMFGFTPESGKNEVRLSATWAI